MLQPQDESQVAEEIKELHLNHLEAFDYILIQTRNSLYKFTVMEPTRGGGLLSGGALGNKQLQAALLGAVCCKKSNSVSQCLTLKVGLSALFFLDEINDEKVNLETKKQLAISPITRLTHVCGGAITKSRSAFSGFERCWLLHAQQATVQICILAAGAEFIGFCCGQPWVSLTLPYCEPVYKPQPRDASA
jgi:hypothetical protein